MRALELIVGTMSRAHNSTNHYEGNYEPTMSLIMRLIVGLIVFFLKFKTQATPLSLLTKTTTVHIPTWGETQDQPRDIGRVGGAVDARHALSGR